MARSAHEGSRSASYFSQVRLSERGERQRELRIARDGALEHADRPIEVAGQIAPVDETPPLRIVLERVRVGRGRAPPRPRRLAVPGQRQEPADRPRRDLRLQPEHVGRGQVELPAVARALRLQIDQAHDDAGPLAGAAHGAGDDVIQPELPLHFSERIRLADVLHRGGARHEGDAGGRGEIRREHAGDSGRQPFLGPRVLGGERQHRDHRRRLRPCGRRRRAPRPERARHRQHDERRGSRGEQTLAARGAPRRRRGGRRRLHGLQRPAELGRRLKACVGVRLERARDDVGERRPHARVHGVGARRALAERAQQVRRVGSRVRAPSRRHLEQDHAQAVDVRAVIHTPAEPLLRRHVGRRAPLDHGHAAPRRRRARRRARRQRHRLRHAEVEHLDRLLRRHLDIGRLQIAVHDASGVRRGERRRELPAERHHALGGQRPATQPVGKALALHVLHDDEGARLVFDDVVNDGDVRVVDARRRARLLKDPCAHVGGRRAQEALQRDLAVKTRVVAEEHLAHAAATQPLDEEVRADAGAERQVVRRAPGRRPGECVVILQERRGLIAQGRIRAPLVQEAGAPFLRLRDGLGDDRLHLLPGRGIHLNRPPADGAATAPPSPDHASQRPEQSRGRGRGRAPLPPRICG